jgi:pyranose oxidase
MTHEQIHRDAFSYGLVPEIYDQRTIVDLRFFGYVRPRRENRVEFSRAKPGKPANKDMFGMPQVCMDGCP